MVCADAATLVYLADQACLVPHVWLSRADRPDHPDRMVFDLDPPGDGGLDPVRSTARSVRDAVEEVGLVPFLMATGSRGFHVLVPLRPELPFDEVRAFAHDLARLLTAREPDRLTVEPRKDRRRGRVFLDHLRNAYAQTTLAAYALRARPGAPVAAPLDWDELGKAAPAGLTLRTIFRRLGQKQDPWRDHPRHARSLSEPREALDRLLAETGIGRGDGR